MLLTAIGGGLIGGVAGHFGGHWIADFIYEELAEASDSLLKIAPDLRATDAPVQRYLAAGRSP